MSYVPWGEESEIADWTESDLQAMREEQAERDAQFAADQAEREALFGPDHTGDTTESEVSDHGDTTESEIAEPAAPPAPPPAPDPIAPFPLGDAAWPPGWKRHHLNEKALMAQQFAFQQNAREIKAYRLVMKQRRDESEWHRLMSMDSLEAVREDIRMKKEVVDYFKLHEPYASYTAEQEEALRASEDCLEYLESRQHATLQGTQPTCFTHALDALVGHHQPDIAIEKRDMDYVNAGRHVVNRHGMYRLQRDLIASDLTIPRENVIVYADNAPADASLTPRPLRDFVFNPSNRYIAGIDKRSDGMGGHAIAIKNGRLFDSNFVHHPVISRSPLTYDQFVRRMNELGYKDLRLGDINEVVDYTPQEGHPASSAHWAFLSHKGSGDDGGVVPSRVVGGIVQDEGVALSDADIRRLLPGCKITLYTQLDRVPSLDSIFDSQGRAVILYLTESKNAGHWCGILKNPHGYEYFDAYGLKPGSPLHWNPAVTARLKERPCLITQLLERSGRPVSYNTHCFQKHSNRVATCGRHVVVRQWNKGMSLADYARKIAASGMDADAYVTQQTDSK